MRCLLGFGVGACCGVEDKVLQIVVTINYLEKGTGLAPLRASATMEYQLSPHLKFIKFFSG
jgi:hypothetical protein